MIDRETPAIIAFLGGGVLALLLAVPYIAWSYRRRGEFGLGHMVLALGCLVYALALWTYTLLPVPDTTPEWCARHATEPQLRPFQFLADIGKEADGARSLLDNSALQQVVLNIALFVPLGMFGRHLFRGKPLVVVAAGFAMSLFIECTQLTGVWGLFGCSYRLFDVDDLLVNTTGAVVGVVMAPILRLVPGQRVRLAPTEPRPVTMRRRLLGSFLDLLFVTLFAGVLMAVRVLVTLIDHPEVHADPDLDWLLGYAIPIATLLLFVPLAGRGATMGQRIVMLAPVGPDGGPPSSWRLLLRFAGGTGGYFTLVMCGWNYAAALLIFASFVLMWRPRDHRGLSGLVSGLRVIDARARRSPADESADAPEEDAPEEDAREGLVRD
ncbi:VanZ family protein [Amycolatopsis minnesotensis]|uniref:VanZ family protein n=1 Tax=Amycolatopsis minnesotensis TaxID=337894 RepID=A0ABN2QTF6_9PSEU